MNLCVRTYYRALLSEVEQEQRPSGNGDREAIVVGAGFCDSEGEVHTQHMPHIMIVNRLEANKECFRPEGFDEIRPHFIRSLQFDQKVRPLSFRTGKFNIFTATPLPAIHVLRC